MKKSAKPLIVIVMFLLLVITALVLISVGLRLKYEESVRTKVELQKILKSERTKKVNLVANYQMVAAEDVITRSAKNDLGMVKNIEPGINITVSKDKIEELSQLLKEKYD
jgi:cell division protein FtsB